MVTNFASETNQPKYYSISEVNRLFNLTLERTFPILYFAGEISEIKKASSGHIYFTVKDAESQVSAVMWSGMARSLKFELAAGMAVLCHGKPNVYNKSGRLQIVVNEILLAGEGLLQKRFLELKEKLEKEGLFDTARKRQLPFLPKAVGIVTSAQGAAIHDMTVRFRERMPNLKLYLVDVRVQGPGAAEEIAAAIKYLNQSGLVDLIIIGRGGGSLEDLWAFNEEVVVRAVFGSKAPIVSAVGHEVDFSLSDYAADLRAPTPTAAAEMVVPKRSDLLKLLDEYRRRLADTDRLIRPLEQELDELVLRFDSKISTLMDGVRNQLKTIEARLVAISPLNLIKLLRSKVEALSERLKGGLPLSKIESTFKRIELLAQRFRTVTDRQFRMREHVLENLASRLEAMSPRRVLERGYSMVEMQGKVVKSVKDIAVDDLVKVSFFDGAVSAEVRQKIN